MQFILLRKPMSRNEGSKKYIKIFFSDLMSVCTWSHTHTCNPDGPKVNRMCIFQKKRNKTHCIHFLFSLNMKKQKFCTCGVLSYLEISTDLTCWHSLHYIERSSLPEVPFSRKHIHGQDNKDLLLFLLILWEFLFHEIKKVLGCLTRKNDFETGTRQKGNEPNTTKTYQWSPLRREWILPKWT